MPQPDQIGRLDLRAELPDGEAAARLRARIENLGWRLLPRAIERTIDAFGPIDGHLRIERLALDLGTVDAANLEAETLAALERALAEALRDALGNARHAPTGAVRLQDGAAWRLEQYETYLATGTVANAPSGDPFVPEAAFASLAQTQPDRLVAALRRRARAPHVVERLAAQLDAAAFAALLALLAPADARAILDLLAQTLLAHRTALLKRSVRLQERELERTLWIATLAFLLRDPGSQFNRRRYLEHLLRREAVSAGIGYEALLALLAQALDVVAAAFGATATLPLTLSELLAERGLAQEPRGRSRTSFAPAQDADAALARWRKLADAADTAPFEAAAHALTQAELERVVAATAPFARTAIRRAFGDVEKLLAGEAPPGAVRARVLRSLLAHAAAGPFDLVAWRRALMRQIAVPGAPSRVVLQRRAAESADAAGRRLRRGRARIADLRGRRAVFGAAVAAEAALSRGIAAQLPPHAKRGADFENRLAAAIDAALAAAPTTARDAAAIVAAALAELRRSGDAEIRMAAAAAAGPASARSRAALPHATNGADIQTAHDATTDRAQAVVEADIADARGRDAAAWRPQDPVRAQAAVAAAMAAEFEWAYLAQIGTPQAAEQSLSPTAHRVLAAFASAAPLLAATLAASAATASLARPIAAALGSLSAHFVGVHAQARGAASADAVRALHMTVKIAAAYVDARRGAPISVAALAAHVARMRTRAAGVPKAGDPQRRLARRLRHAARRDRRALALLALEAADSAPVPRLALLAALAPGHATDVAAAVATLLHALNRRDADMPSQPALARLVWAQAFSRLAADRSARLSPATLQAQILADLAHALGDDLQDVAATLAAPPPPKPRTHDEAAVTPTEIARFLRYGRPHAAADRLVAAAARAPADIGAVVREIAASSPALVPAMLDRLLAVLAPEELHACLAPHRPEAAWLPRDRGPALDAFFAGLLAGTAPQLPPPEKPGPYVDGLVGLRDSLDADGSAAHPLVAALPAFSLGELAWLFLAPDAARSATRLRRAVAALAPDRAEALLDKMAPWGDDALARLARSRGRAALPPADTAEMRLRVALAGLADDKFDLFQVAAGVDEVSPIAAPVAASAPVSRDPVSRRSLFAWLGGARIDPPQVAAYAAAFADLADGDDPELAAFVAAARGRPRVQAHWAAALPLGARARLLGLLAKPKARLLLDVALLASAAWRQTAPFGAKRPNEQAIWTVLFAALAAPREVKPGDMLALLVDSFAGKDASLAVRLRRRLANLVRDGGHAALAAALRRTHRRPPEAASPPASALPKNGAPREGRAPPPKAPLYVGNAGLVLLGPFLPHLFARLDVLATPEGEAPRMRDRAAATRAVHLLQYLVDRRLDAPEPQLVLNKLLCGLLPADAVDRQHDPSEDEISTCKDLLRTVVERWTVLRNTGADGLREVFLQRAGRLTFGAERCDLKVERKGMDVLIARIPWSIALVKHRWMAAPLYVDW